MTVDESILEKIRKVAGYTKSSNPNEAAVAAAKLTEMLLKYNLDASQISQSMEKPDPFDRTNTDDDGKRLPDWHIDLAVAIARANLCKVVISGSRLIWLGRKSNLEVAQYIYHTTCEDLVRIAAATWSLLSAFAKQEEIDIVHGKTWKNSFYRDRKSVV